MFGNQKQKLENKYKSLLSESHRLSRIDRKKSDEKLAEAEQVRQQIQALESKSN